MEDICYTELLGLVVLGARPEEITGSVSDSSPYYKEFLAGVPEGGRFWSKDHMPFTFKIKVEFYLTDFEGGDQAVFTPVFSIVKPNGEFIEHPDGLEFVAAKVLGISPNTVKTKVTSVVKGSFVERCVNSLNPSQVREVSYWRLADE